MLDQIDRCSGAGDRVAVGERLRAGDQVLLGAGDGEAVGGAPPPGRAGSGRGRWPGW
ncbi:hypothetical protein ACFQZ4_18850 [Catellatospora coxensis]